MTNVSLQKLLPTKPPTDHPRGHFSPLKRSQIKPYKRGHQRKNLVVGSSKWLDMFVCETWGTSLQLATNHSANGPESREFLASFLKSKDCWGEQAFHFSEFRGFIQKNRRDNEVWGRWKYMPGGGKLYHNLGFQEMVLKPTFFLGKPPFLQPNPMGFWSFLPFLGEKSEICRFRCCRQCVLCQCMTITCWTSRRLLASSLGRPKIHGTWAILR